MKLGEYVRKKKKYTHFTTKIMKMHFKTSLKLHLNERLN